MNDIEVPLVFQKLEVAADRLVRHAENVGQLADAHRPGGAQALHDLGMAANGERSNHATSRV